MTALAVAAALPGYPPSLNAGSWLTTHVLLRALAAHGHRVDVAVPGIRRGYRLDDVRVWPCSHGSLPSQMLDRADVVVTHADDPRKATAGRAPLVRIVHSADAALRSALRSQPADLTVLNSHHARDQLSGLTGRSVVIHPPVCVADYETTPGDCVTLVNLNVDKGAAVFYELAERLPGVPFLGVEGGYGVQVTKRGPGDLPNCTVLHHVPAQQMRDRVYARTRLLLMPSAQESWGRTGIEAMASGIPVIAHPTGGLREALGSAGRFVDRDDLDGWERAVRLLLVEQHWAAASRKAKARVAELDPVADLDRWRREVERIADRKTSGVRIAG